MDIQIILIIILQILNMLLSSFVPIISNFFQTISHSECMGCLSIDRKVKNKNNKSLKSYYQKNNNKNNELINDINNIV